MQVVSRTFRSRGLASLGPPIGISIGTNSDRELGDSAGFLHRGEKSLNRRSYRRAPLIDETPWLPMLRTAIRDKDPISTSRSRKGYAASSCLHPLRISLSDISDGKPRGFIRAESALQEIFRIHFIFFIWSSIFRMHFLFIFNLSLSQLNLCLCDRDLS